MRSIKHARRTAAGLAVTGLAVAGLSVLAAPANASGGVWDRVAQCESGGNWSINTGNGYHGGLQFSKSTWKAFGGTKYAPTADKATKAQQIEIAQKTLQRQGPGAWPTCSKKAGLTRANGGAAVAPAPVQAAPAPQAQSGKTYTVKRGDTMAKIARAHGVAGGYKALAAANGIANPNVIAVGQVLRLP